MVIADAEIGQQLAAQPVAGEGLRPQGIAERGQEDVGPVQSLDCLGPSKRGVGRALQKVEFRAGAAHDIVGQGAGDQQFQCIRPPAGTG